MLAGEEAQVIALVNEAFMIDAYFKHPNKTQRIKLHANDPVGMESMQDILATSVILVCVDDDAGLMLGCVRVEIKNSAMQIASFGMLSVKATHTKRGIGSALVHAAEEYSATKLDCITMEILVVNLQHGIIDFYTKLDYSQHPNLIDFEEIVGDEVLLPEYKPRVRFILMWRNLLLMS